MLPELTFYRYTLKEGDTFWNVMARTSMNIDTLMTVNSLSNPDDILPGKELFIPNMRGIVYHINSGETLKEIAERYEVAEEYILKTNRISSLSKEYIFIPCGEVDRGERFAFIGNGFIKPLSSIKVTSAFGKRMDPFRHVQDFHSGVDLKCTIGTPVKAAKKGVVIFAGYSGNYGKLVIIQHSSGYKTYYAHLQTILVNRNKRVKAGEIIAKSGNTGRSTGPHLHFEIRKNNKPVNPLSKLN